MRVNYIVMVFPEILFHMIAKHRTLFRPRSKKVTQRGTKVYNLQGLGLALSIGGRPVQAARAFLGPAPTGYFPQAQASSYLLGK